MEIEVHQSRIIMEALSTGAMRIRRTKQRTWPSPPPASFSPSTPSRNSSGLFCRATQRCANLSERWNGRGSTAFRRWILDFERWILDFRFWILGVRSCVLILGYGLLTEGWRSVHVRGFLCGRARDASICTVIT